MVLSGYKQSSICISSDLLCSPIPKSLGEAKLSWDPGELALNFRIQDLAILCIP